MYWDKLSENSINKIVNKRLAENIGYSDNPIFGIPASKLNQKVFPYKDFLENSPFLKTMLENPNHIGCHTTGSSESFFKGSQKIEQEVIEICSEKILEAKKNSIDGYIASGGTESNIQALWIFRNYVMEKFKAMQNEIAVIYSSDTHYSIHKACNLLGIKPLEIPVNSVTRQMNYEILNEILNESLKLGLKYFFAVLNMGTTMFGSVDNLQGFLKSTKECNIECMIHIDAAFGGFIYPFSGKNHLNFKCPQIFSVSMDGHKILQSPYGTGVFLIRKPFIKYVTTKKASYVSGHDQTLCGSRSGALSVAMWMILKSYGGQEWSQFIEGLIDKTNYLINGLDDKNIPYFREEGINIVTIPSGHISNKLLDEYHWVSDHPTGPQYFKAVMMNHVTYDHLDNFIKAC